MKPFFTIVGYLLLCLGIQAQEGQLLSAERSTAVMGRITQATTAIQSMQCRFTQTKQSPLLAQAAVAQGRMSYTRPSSLRLEYTAPYDYVLVVEGDSVSMTSQGKKAPSAAWKSGVKRMTGMVMSSLNGQRLFDQRLFDISLYELSDCYRAVMKPKRKDMRRMFASITFTFNKQSLLVERVELTEGEGTTTTLQFDSLSVKKRNK